MKSKTSVAVAGALLLALLFAASVEQAFAQRGGRRGGGGQTQPLDEATILAEFDKIVELIWTDDEKDAWEDARSDEAKQAFITAFWERRDPTPGTTDNEFREQWMLRVSAANQRYAGEGRPGYETDRGKFFLIYGPYVLVAEERKQVAGSGQAGLGAESSGVTNTSTNIIWTLDPTQNPFLEGKETVTFAQYQRSYSKVTGGIEYSQEAFLADRTLQAYFEERRANPAAAGPRAAAAPPTGTAATAGTPPTPDVLAMQQLIQNGVTRQDFSLQQAMGFIPAQGGNSFAIFNFEIGKSGLTFESGGAPGPAELLAFGVLLKKDPAAANGERFFRQMQIAFNVDPGDGDAEETGTHSFGMTLEPGGYRLAWGVMDKASERIVTNSYEFEVPNFTAGELAIPSVILASGIEEQTDEIDVNTIYGATRVGNLELRTDLDNVFGRNDELLALYFIQGLAADPSTQQVNYEIEHRILLAGTDTSIARFPLQALNFPAIQQPIPLALVEQIEPGADYEIEIHIKDLVNNNEMTHRVPFSTREG